MATSEVAAGKKRAAPASLSRLNDSKRRKTDIQTQNAPKELNVATFVKAREFEIKALENSMAKARRGLMTRAFQQVPRNMRRRTASHNVKKVPKRLRKRVVEEMKHDNTATVSKRTRTPSRKLRLRLDTAKKLKSLNQRSKTVRQKKREAKANAKETGLAKQNSISRVPRVKKYKLAEPPKATTKYKKRQVNKTWLPTHLWHTKRARMTRPTEPLWRLAIPLSPTEKSYRPTHRAFGTRGSVAWDQSYVSTVSCLGTEHTLENMLRLLGFSTERESGALLKMWKTGTRYIRGWLHEVDDDERLIGQATVIWMVNTAERLETGSNNQAESTDSNEVELTDGALNKRRRKRKVKLDRRLFIRVHPSLFQRFWIELVKAAKMQKPQVLVEDLRFEVGSIEIAGPGSTEALLGVLKPRHATQTDTVESIWSSLAGLDNVSSLPSSCILAFDIVDPRLSQPPKQTSIPKDVSHTDELNQILVTWTPDTTLPPSNLFSHKHRWTAGATMPTQKSINRRRSEVGTGKSVPILDKDPSIPIVLLANRASPKELHMQGSWTVLLPWPCVDAVWRSLMYYPLSSGGTPRFGGLKQTQQLAFEQMIPWFPGDFSGTEAGKAWERSEAERRFDEWVRRPPSRRIRWDLLDLGLDRTGELGRGWSCDWEWLLSDAEKRAEVTQRADGLSQDVLTKEARKKGKITVGVNIRKSKKEAKAKEKAEQDQRRNTSSPESSDDEGQAPHLEEEPDYIQLMPLQATTIFKSPGTVDLPAKQAIATVRLRLLTKGTPSAAARIYRLPTAHSAPAVQSQQMSSANANESTLAFTTQPTNSHPSTPPSPLLRSQWLSLLPSTFHHPNQILPKPGSSKPLTHRGLPPKHTVPPPDPPTHIHVLPPKAPQQIIDEFGPPPPPTASQLKQRQREALMAELMKFDLPPAGSAEKDNRWDVTKGLVPCPDETDLIGFVTSGGFNLREGRGTGIGGVWVQRVVEGWRGEEADVEKGMEGMDKGKLLASQARKIEKERKRREKERYLCVVRNAGECVGRLAVWEVCE